MAAVALLVVALIVILALIATVVYARRIRMRRDRLIKHGVEAPFRVLRSTLGISQIEYVAGGVPLRRTINLPSPGSALALSPPEQDAVLLIDPADARVCAAFLREKLAPPPSPLETARLLGELMRRYAADVEYDRALHDLIQRTVTTDEEAEAWIKDLNAAFASREQEDVLQSWLAEDCTNHPWNVRRSLAHLNAYRKLEWHQTHRMVVLFAIPAAVLMTIFVVVIPGRPFLWWMPPVLFAIAYLFIWLTQHE